MAPSTVGSNGPVTVLGPIETPTRTYVWFVQGDLLHMKHAAACCTTTLCVGYAQKYDVLLALSHVRAHSSIDTNDAVTYKCSDESTFTSC